MIKKLAFNLKTNLSGRSSLSALDEFREVDRMNAGSIETRSLHAAAAHARFAFHHTAFYRDYYSSHGFTASDLEDDSAFNELPIVEKHMLRDHFDEVRSDEATTANSTVSKTGGSTGLPLHLLRDLRFPARALEWRLFDWWNIHPWENRAIVTRHILTGQARTRHRLAWLPSRHIQLDAFRITDESVTAFVQEWNRTRPAIMVGYGGGVLDAARRMNRLGLSVTPPRAIAVTAAPLTPGTREEIERAFGAPCYDHYRSSEVPWIAGECDAQNGLHVLADVRRVEILDESDRPVPPGAEGQVIVSDLTNRVFPIIRYRLGDISSLTSERCSCGRELPRLGAIAGRTSDTVRLPNGTAVAGALGHIFDDYPYSVRQFEIVQASDHSVTLRCIPGEVDTADGIAHAEQKLREATQGTVPVRVEIVDSIPQVGGKMRFIRSDAPAIAPLGE